MKDIYVICGAGFMSSTVAKHLRKIAQKRNLSLNISWGAAIEFERTALMRNPQILLENADKNCIKEQEAEVRIKWAVPGEIFDGEANNFQNINFENTGVVFISPHIRSLYNAIRKQIPETVAVELLNLESLGDYDALLELALNIMND